MFGSFTEPFNLLHIVSCMNELSSGIINLDSYT